MTDLSQQIFNILESTIDSGLYMPMTEFQNRLGVRDRALQSEKGKPGLLDLAADEIYNEKHLFLMTRNGTGGGAKLTKSVKEYRQSRNTLLNHACGEIKKVERMDAKIKDFMNPTLRLVS